MKHIYFRCPKTSFKYAIIICNSILYLFATFNVQIYAKYVSCLLKYLVKSIKRFIANIKDEGEGKKGIITRKIYA